MRDIFGIEGRVAVVTGGLGQLGTQFCRTLASAGAKVAIFSRRPASEELLAREVSRPHRPHQGLCRQRHRQGRARSGNRGAGRRLGRPPHPRQQRRHRFQAIGLGRSERAVRGLPEAVLGRDHRNQPHRRHAVLSGGRREDGRGPARQHHQCRLDVRHRLAQPGALCLPRGARRQAIHQGHLLCRLEVRAWST